jgi:hypothetical protein
MADYSVYENIVAYDCSGSTDKFFGDTKFYHTKTQDIVKNLNTKTTLFIRWDDGYNIISKEDLREINMKQKGYGGTSPFKLFEFIKHINYKGELTFISDGQIDDYSANRCSDILIESVFSKVNIHLIYTGGNINESVSCAMIRNSPHEIKIYKNKEYYNNPIVISVTNEDFNLVNNLDSISTIEKFIEQKEILKNVLFSINTGTKGNKVLHAKLVELKNKLIKIESKSFAKNSNDPVSRLIDSFEKQELSLSILDEVWKMYYNIDDNDNEDDWKKVIDKFISWCSGSLTNSFDRNKTSNREDKAIITPVFPPESIEILEEKMDNLKITCPITLSDSTNIIVLMKKTDLNIFNNLPTDIKDSLINCPLNALKNNDILNYIKSLFDCVISIEAYKELVEHGISDCSPLTRDDIFGGLCLGKDKSHVNATNSTLRYILTSGKSLGNIDLWFAILYFLVKRGHVEHLKEYLPAFEEHMKFRLLKSKSYMCLSGLSSYPTYSVPLGLAMWCSIMATTSDLALMKNASFDPIRIHLAYSLDIIELLNILNISVPDNLVEHINRLKMLRIFLQQVKKGKNETLKLKNQVEALFYNAIETSELWVFIDGTPSEDQINKVKSRLPKVCENFSNADIKYILDICDSNKAESDIYIPYRYTSQKNVITNTKTWDLTNDVPSTTIHICPETCRPYYNVADKNGFKSTWLDEAIKIYGYNLFSTDNFYGRYISEHKKYPSKSKFLNYIFLYYYTRSKITLPICVEKFVDEVLDDYQDIMINVSPNDFAERWTKSMHINVRISMEMERRK